MNIGSKIVGNPSKNCCDISLKTINVNLLAAIEENSKDHQKSLRYVIWEPSMSVQSFVANL